MKSKLLYLSTFLLAFSTLTNAQQKEKQIIKCTSTEQDAALAKKYNTTREQMVEHFESWLHPLVEKAKKEGTNKRSTQNVLTIPVVFHVFHNGDAVGSGENIADLQLQSQITVLNQDYRRMLNTPGHNNHAVGADVEIEFCLAKVDPNNQYTTGIVRHLISQDGLSDSQIENYKIQKNWDTSKYLNIYIVKFPSSIFGETLGYAQFPIGSGLPGLSAGMSLNDLATTDGVVLNYKATGSRAIYPQGTYLTDIDGGRTATHEIGHWLGLRHIWGDANGCNSGTDYCNDTPNHQSANYGCLTGRNVCGYVEMPENYMDYSDDACFNLFTQDQKTRIRTVLQNDPRRASLFVGNRCTYTSTSQIDLGIIESSITSNNCGTATVNLGLRNLGTSTITSATITFSVAGQNTVANINQAIAPNTNYNLSQVLNLNIGNNTINAVISSVNGSTTADQNTGNNTVSFTKNVQTYQTNSTVLNVSLRTDRYAEETSWSFTGPGVSLNSSALSNSTSYNYNFQMVQDGCYVFTINDSEGDGICCSYGSGNLTVTLDGTQIYNAGNFEDSKVFEIRKGTLSTDDFALNNSITLYPNPTNNILNIMVKDSNLPTAYTIYNTLGQTVKQNAVNSSNDLAINVQNLTTGIYFIKLDKNGSSQTLRFIKN